MATCARCGTDNAEAANFCSTCGARLSPAPAREQRKTVTVLFCDVSGSTALGERIDPEALQEIMYRYYDGARAAIERHGGTVEKFIGDAVMAVFGIPTAHEDDALRAVRAALELRDVVDIDVRIGINTGEVVTGGPDKAATGDAVNVAARLEQAAATGEILVGSETYALLRHATEAELLPPVEAKGKSAPLTAYRLRAVTGDLRPRRAAAMVGRTGELDLLAHAYDRAVREQACHLFTVLGVAGIGKSRLVAEFLARLHDARVVTGRCLSYGEGITYWPVVEVLEQLGTPVESVLRDGTTPPEIAWSVRKTLEQAALDRPLVAVFDDIQWGEATFLDLIEHVADLSRDAPILLLCMARPELLDARPGWGGGKLNATSVLLEPLPRGETGSLVHELLGEAEPALVARIRDAADGNPLFVEEMVELARASGGEVAVPPSIQALLGARLDSLPPAERAVLERGAVEGQVFHRGAVAALTPDEPQVDTQLVALVRKELVRPDRPALARDDAYRFRHLLIRDAAYEALPKATRIDLHERFATWLEEHGADLVELDEIVGYHLEQASRYAAELGRPSPELAARAAERLFAASRHAHARADANAQLNLVRRAEALHERGDPRRLALLPHLGLALYETGDWQAALRVFDEAIEHGDPATSARAHVGRASVRAHTSAVSHAEGLAEIDGAIVELERLGAVAALPAAYTARGRMLFWEGRHEEAGAATLLAREQARAAGDLQAEVDAVEELLVSLDWSAAPRPEVERVARELLADERLGPRLQARTRITLGRVAIGVGRFEEASSLIADAVRRYHELGLAIHAGILELSFFDIGWITADWELAESGARTSWDQLGELGESGYRSTAGASLAYALARLGRDEEAAAIVETAERMASPDDYVTAMLALMARSRLAANAGETERAAALAREGWSAIAEREDAAGQLSALVMLAEALVAAGDVDGATRAVDDAVALAKRRVSPALAERARAVLAPAPQQ